MEINVIAGRSTSLELLFHFRSLLLRYRWNYIKAISLPHSRCAVLVKDEILALNPPVSPQASGLLAVGVATCVGMYLYVLAGI